MIELVIFLVVLIIALAIGNVLLSISNPESEPKNSSQPAGLSNSGLKSGNSGNAMPSNFNSNQLNGLNRRVDRVENLLLKLGNSAEVSRKLAELKLSQKVNELNEFRQSAKIELEALSEKIDSLDEKMNPHNLLQKNPEEEDAEFQQKIHNIIYNRKT